MRILLDECVNPRVKDGFSDHQVRTVKEMGWAGITNGKLMALAQNEFDVFLTVDKNLQHQQNLAKLSMGIVVVGVPDNNIKYFRTLFLLLLNAIDTVSQGEVIRIDHPEFRRR